MNSKPNFIVSLVQFVVGILAIAAFAVVGFGGEKITKWIITLLLAVGYVVLGVIGIINYKPK